ncbi:MAG: hypothetical protein ACYTFG_19575 [Planctomycetota bacterium]|jgi:hypothetical protein
MAMIVVPIPEGKVEAWESWIQELRGPRSAEVDEFCRRYNLTKHRVWSFRAPMGHVAIVLHEGPGAGGFMGKLSASGHEFDKWFVSQLAELHSLDLSAPMPGAPPELKFDWCA